MGDGARRGAACGETSRGGASGEAYSRGGASGEAYCGGGVSGEACGGVASGETYVGVASGEAYGGAFAALYDRLIAKDYSYSRYARYLDAQIRRHGRAGSAQLGAARSGAARSDAARSGDARSGRAIVADLGCGSGLLCIELARLGYDMVGIDRSPSMLALAQEKARDAGVDALFLLQDMRRFELYGTVAAIVSTIDAINYVTGLAGLRRVFSLAANYLDPGGVFIFDVSTRHKLERAMGGGAFFDISDDRCLFWQCRFDRRSAIAAMPVTLFVRRPDGAYDRHDETHRQRAHSPEELADAARAAGLELVAEHAFMAARKAPPDAQKICYVFRK